MSKTKARLMNSLKFIIPLIILFYIYKKTNNFFQQLNWDIVVKRIPEMNIGEILIILTLGFLASGVMIHYDILFNKRLDLKIPTNKLVKYSWIANTFNNFFGFGGLAGAGIRSALYRKHHPNFKEIIKTIAWSTPLMLTGVSILLVFVLIDGIGTFINLEGVELLKPVLWGIVMFLPLYLVVLGYKKKLTEKTDRAFVIKMLITSVLEWFSCFVLFFVISHIIGISVPISFLYGLFFVGKFVGVISMAPGGVGAFDYVMLQGLSQHGILKEDALLLLVLYRLSYFILPWVVGFVLALTELGKDWFYATRKAWSVSEKTFTNVSHKILTAMVFLSGIILMSNYNHLVVERIKLAEEIIPHSWLELSLELSILIGFILILLSRAVYVKIKIGFHLTFILLILGAIFTFSRGFQFEDSIFLLILATLLWLSRKNFHRKNYALRWEELSCWLVVIVAFVFYYTYVSFHLNSDMGTLDVLKEMAAELIITVLAISLFLYFISPKMKKITLQDDGQKEKVLNHLELYKGHVLSHMVFLNDKYIHWSENENVLFLYQIIADKIVVLGEPVGKKEEIGNAIDEFQRYANGFGMNVIFYQIGKENLDMYHEKGYSFFKLGEDSIVDLNQFTLSGKKASNLRNQMNRFNKAGYQFDVINPPHNMSIMNQLQMVSNDWLKKRKEKGFSMGSFDEEYLQMSSIAILKDEHDKIIAFSNLTPVYDSEKTLSLDLMRYKTDSPVGTMDVLFCYILDWSKQQSYQYFDLRMAPLSNVGQSDFSFTSEKIAYKFYLYGSSIYGFSGLRKYKEKFTTNWDSKYLAYRNKNTFTMTMLQVSLIIQKAKRVNKKKK